MGGREMKTKRLYVSLPISGYDLDERKSEAERIKSKLNFCGLSIIEVVTPFDVCPEADKPYSYYMGKDIEALLECDAIYMCEGWQNSKGCMAEFEVARIYGKEIIFDR